MSKKILIRYGIIIFNFYPSGTNMHHFWQPELSYYDVYKKVNLNCLYNYLLCECFISVLQIFCYLFLQCRNGTISFSTNIPDFFLNVQVHI